MTWKEYLNRLRISTTDNGMRLQVLDMARQRFIKYGQFSSIPTEERKFIAGVANNFDSGIPAGENDEPWKAFGTMSGFGIFASRVINNDPKISEALDNIPLTGQVTKHDFEEFVRLYLEVFGGNPIGTATRLLAMKRPDLFYCITSANQKDFCADFGLTRSHVMLETYWDMVVERIQDSDWWQNPTPKNKTERAIKDCRAALLDSIYYQWE